LALQSIAFIYKIKQTSMKPPGIAGLIPECHAPAVLKNYRYIYNCTFYEIPLKSAAL